MPCRVRFGKLLLIGLTSVLLAPGVLAEWSEPVKLNSNINGVSDERFPFVTADNQRFYWSSSSFPEGHGTNEDIYVSEWDTLLEDWGPRQVLGPEINTWERELSPCESPDRRYLWFTRWNPGMGYDLYYAVWDTANGKWGTAVNAGPQFNSPCVENAVSISPDGKRMFLVHGRRPGIAMCEGEVFWISYWNDSTQWWDTLIWMGDVLNAAASRYSATMSLDTTCFFTATGSNLGDLFRVSNNAPFWDTITNLGEPPNSTAEEENLAISPDGRFLYFTSWRDTTGGAPDIYVSEWMNATGVRDEPPVPADFILGAAYPNPFNASTRISYTLDRPAEVTLSIYDVLGRKVETLAAGPRQAGEHTLVWDAGERASGVYFIVLEALSNLGGDEPTMNGGAPRVRKALLLK